MNKMILVFLLNVSFAAAHCQQWTEQQLQEANTAKDIAMLSTVEKEAIQYINLARMFPATFALVEVQAYTGPARYGSKPPAASYKGSLLKQLALNSKAAPLYFDEQMYAEAKCFAEESGKRGTVGHKRKKCSRAYAAECCSYGMESGRDIVMQWLVDEDVPALGHRANCLNPAYRKIGLSVHPHKKYGTCAVADFNW